MSSPTIYGLWNFRQWDGDKIALIDPDEKAWTRRELIEEGNKIAHGLRAMGLKKGDTVAAMLPNCAIARSTWRLIWQKCKRGYFWPP